MQWAENAECSLRNCGQHNEQRVPRTLKKWNSFVGLMICEKSEACKLQCNFPDQSVHQLGRIYDGEFDSALVKNELMMPYVSSITKLDNGNKAATWLLHLNVKVNQSNFHHPA